MSLGFIKGPPLKLSLRSVGVTTPFDAASASFPRPI